MVTPALRHKHRSRRRAPLPSPLVGEGGSPRERRDGWVGRRHCTRM